MAASLRRNHVLTESCTAFTRIGAGKLIEVF